MRRGSVAAGDEGGGEVGEELAQHGGLKEGALVKLKRI